MGNGFKKKHKSKGAFNILSKINRGQAPESELDFFSKYGHYHLVSLSFIFDFSKKMIYCNRQR